MNEKAYERVISYLETLIRERKIRCGDKMPSERELAATLGLGRNSVREALRMMEHTGIVKSRHGKGNFFVNQPEKSLNSVFSMMLLTGQSNFGEVSRIRCSLEMEAFEEAVSAEKSKREQLTEILRRMEAEPEQAGEYDSMFHDCLIQLSGNQLLRTMMQSLAGVCDAEIRQVMEECTQEDAKCLLSYHREICRCLDDGNVEAGKQQIQGHYNYIDAMLNEK